MTTFAKRIREIFGTPRSGELSSEQMQGPRRQYKNLGERFTEVYRGNLWEDTESVSGPGSRRSSGSVFGALDGLRTAYEKVGFRSINDIPCGDFNWMGSFLSEQPTVLYQGFDVVPDLIQCNRSKFGPRYSFECLDITVQVPPRADLIFCKDLLNHLSIADIAHTLENMIKSGSSFLLSSNNFFLENHVNEEIQDVLAHASRCIDITKPPFNVPSPVWNTHYMGLWDLSALKQVRPFSRT